MKRGEWHERVQLTLVDVRRVSLLADLAALLLLAVSGRRRLSLLRGLRALRGRLGRRLRGGGCGGLAGGGSGLGCHW